MKIEQIYTSCLSQGTYYIESKGEVAIIDPLREVAPYIKKAKNNSAKIKYIFETHFHADFVSGHVTLSQKTGAPIVYGPNARTTFEAIIAKDEQQFTIGDITITALHTPGHTMESTTYLLRDQNKKAYAIFSGDTLFLGDVGRPDLAQKGEAITGKDLAGYLYDSLRTKIMPLPDHTIVYPAHGAGSSCGKNLSSETIDTLGNQKKTNYALRETMTRDEFINEVTNGLLPPPKYFPLNVKMNKEGYEHIDHIIEKGTRPLSPSEFQKTVVDYNAIILDVRNEADFAEAHIPNAIFIGLDGAFAPWVGTILTNVKQPIVLVASKGKEEEAVTRLSRVGFDNTLGYLKGGITSWKAEKRNYDTVNSITAIEFKKIKQSNKVLVFDVRKHNEFKSSHVVKANNIPLRFLTDHHSEFPLNNTFYIHCAGGYRSMIAASILKKQSIHNFINISGGFKAIKDTGIEIGTSPSIL